MLMTKQIMPLMMRESRICDMAIRHLKDQSGMFEDKYKISSDDFYRLFHEGKAGDDEDMFEWKALIEAINEWKQTREQLNFFINDLEKS
ncbi:MAG: hypothetical protein AB7S75_08625 [Desulfococcaceae bacterium]